MKRNWRTVKFVALGFGGLLGLGLLWLAVANAQANRRLEDKLAALKATGEPVTLADLSRKPIPPEQNAATYLNRAQDGIKAVEKPMSADFGKDEKQFYHGKSGGKAFHAAKGVLLENPDVVPLLEKASQCADYNPQLNFKLGAQAFFESEMFPRFGQKRAAVRVLNYQTMVHLADGQIAAAFENCLAMLRLARLFENDPLIVNHLVVLAVRQVAVLSTNLVLRAGPLPKEAHDALEAELALCDPVKAYHHVMLTDRAYGIDEFANAAMHPLDVGGKLPNDKNLESDYLDLMATLIADGPREKPSEAAEQILARSAKLTEMVAPAVRAICEANARSVAEFRALRILNALQLGEQDGESQDPTRLSVPKEVLIDPYNQQPIVIKKLPEGWLIYSIGKNSKDDGGKVEDYSDVGLAPLRDQ